jgi:hypothetical protein
METLTEAADLLLAADLAGMGDVELADHTLELQRQRDRIDLAFARAAAASHARGVGAADGSRSTQAWLRRHAGLPEGRGRAAIEDGQAAEALPLTAGAWADGEISANAARTIFTARAEGFDEQLRACEPELIELAAQNVPRLLVRAVRHFRDFATAGDDERALRERRGLQISSTIDGITELDATLDPETGETVLTAIHAFTDPPKVDDPRTSTQRRADALKRICEIALASLQGDGPREAPRPQVIYMVQHETLVGGLVGAMDGAFTGPIGRTTMERLLCEADVSRVVTGPKGVIIDAGSTRRVPSSAQRRVLTARDQGCRFPGCNAPPGWCQAHHIRHWIDDGPTDLDNLLLLCPFHHGHVHQHGLILVFEDNLLQVFRADGLALAA